ncbi:hypothetical protein CGCSCA4_v015055 [Colletotrichum siamense]|uniref:TPR domain-containing protein n=1 Tax=Colletotrichum siamense TaxID=690259 RepID=A0A9P5BKR1_COLSI|nr:hypothetical protein CGCSCA4_v015055 [Colletotrichum siamense]KAF4840360.1 hypothetical protein CGCSCA2_v015041 [Colletotrichum siamense]
MDGVFAQAHELEQGLSLLRFWSNESDFDIEEIPEPSAKLLQIGDPDSGAKTRAKIQPRGGWGTAVDELEKVQKTSQSDDLYQDGKLPIKFRERSMPGFFREEPVAPNDGYHPRRSEAHRNMFLTCCNFIHPEHPSVTSTDNGVRDYAVNYVLHHWRDIKAEHSDVEQQTEMMETFAPLMLDKSSFARIQEEELKTTFSHDEKFDDSFFNRLRSWAALLPDMKVPLSTEAAEWWALVAERPRDCLLELANSQVSRLQDAVDMNTAEASFSAANGALRLCGKGTILEQQARENFASAEQAVLGLDDLFEDIDLDSNGYHWLAALQFLYRQVQPAESTCLKAMTYSQTPLERVQSLALLSRIRIKGNSQAACEDIQACLRQVHDGSVPLPLRRSVYNTKAQIEIKLGRRQDAGTSYELARSVDPSNLVTGDALRAQMKLFVNEPGKQEFIRTLKTWSPLERLAYLC